MDGAILHFFHIKHTQLFIISCFVSQNNCQIRETSKMYSGVLQDQDWSIARGSVCGRVEDGIWMQYSMGLQVEL